MRPHQSSFTQEARHRSVASKWESTWTASSGGRVVRSGKLSSWKALSFSLPRQCRQDTWPILEQPSHPNSQIFQRTKFMSVLLQVGRIWTCSNSGWLTCQVSSTALDSPLMVPAAYYLILCPSSSSIRWRRSELLRTQRWRGVARYTLFSMQNSLRLIRVINSGLVLESVINGNETET